jgi:small-conductance mechanosensitive channel
MEPSKGTRDGDPRRAADAPPEATPREKIAHELSKLTGDETPVAVLAEVEKRHWGWVLGYALSAAAFAALLYALVSGALGIPESWTEWALRGARTGLFVSITLFVSRIAGAILLSRVENRAMRFNLERVLRLLAGMAVAAIAVTQLVAGWRTTAATLGLASLILGFALQTPITSFIGWVYILTRQPYRVGDRVQIGDAKGDVIDVSYLDTTLWEFGGPFLSGDHPSGRVVKIPNRTVLDSTVFNYSWPLFPYVWNEVIVQVGYDADLAFVESAMLAAAKEHLGADMKQHVRQYKQILAKTPVDEVEVKEKPAVFFRINPNTWVDAVLRYLVLPRRAGATRTQLVRDILERLNAEPEKSRLPRGDAR